MKKYLITGSSGFVGKNFIEHLNNVPGNTAIVGVDIVEPSVDFKNLINVDFSFSRLI